MLDFTELKDLVAKSTDETFHRLKEILSTKSKLYDDLIQTQAQHTEAERSGIQGVIDFKERSLTFNNVNKALLWIINHIEETDLSQKILDQKKEQINVPIHESYTCDRIDQTDDFLDVLDDNKNQKKSYFYLYGDSRQHHESLVKRFGHQLVPSLAKTDAIQEKKPFLFITETIETSRRVDRSILSIIKALLTQFNIPIPERNGLLSQKITNLLESQELKNYGKNDNICILLTIYDENWDKNLTPLIITKFIEDFCNEELPENAPSFLFFFGIEFRKESRSVIQKEVEEVIGNAKYGDGISVLEPVTTRDINGWFRSHSEILKGMHPEDATKKFFSDASDIDMYDVVTKLEVLIKAYKKGLVLKNLKDLI